MDTDKLVQSIGGCGLFHVLLMVAMCLTHLLSAWCLIMMAFGNYDPGWTCVKNNEVNLTSSGLDALDFVSNISRDSSGNASVIRYSGYENNGTENEPMRDTCDVIANCESVRFDSDTSTIVTEWDLVCDRTWISSLIISVQMAGGVLGCFVVGQLCSSLGRKFGLYFSVALCGITNILGVFSVSWEMFAAIRFFMGVGFGGVGTANHPYPLEYVNSRWRAFIAGIPSWKIGLVTFAGAAWILRDWRYIHIATAVLAGISFLPVFWVPESIRWLSVRGRVEEAKQVACKIAKINSKQLPNTDFIDNIAEQEKERLNHKSAYTYFDLLNKNLRARTIILVMLWVITSMAYYCIFFGVKSLSGNFYVNLMLFATMGIPVQLVLPLLVERFGRKWSLISAIGLASLLCFAVVIAYFEVLDGQRGTVITVLALITILCLSVDWNVSSLYIAELFPTVVRSQACAITTIGARIGSIIAPYLIPRDFQHIYISYLLMGALLLSCCGMLLILPDTNKKSLEETLGGGRNEINIENNVLPCKTSFMFVENQGRDKQQRTNENNETDTIDI